MAGRDPRRHGPDPGADRQAEGPRPVPRPPPVHPARGHEAEERTAGVPRRPHRGAGGLLRGVVAGLQPPGGGGGPPPRSPFPPLLPTSPPPPGEPGGGGLTAHQEYATPPELGGGRAST